MSNKERINLFSSLFVAPRIFQEVSYEPNKLLGVSWLTEAFALLPHIFLSAAGSLLWLILGENESFCVDGGAVSVTIVTIRLVRKAFQYCTDLRQHAGRDHYLRYLIYSVPSNIEHGSLRWCALLDVSRAQPLLAFRRQQHATSYLIYSVASFALLVCARRQQSAT
jgi:hypothetical protein